MPDVVDAPSEMEEILGRLVAAGVAQPEALSTLLGVEPVEIGRPLRALLRVGIVAAGASGGLQVTPRGAAWLELPLVDELTVEAVTVSDLPVLEPLPMALERRAEAPSTERRPGMRLPFRPVSFPLVRLPRLGIPAFALDRRRLAMAGASVMLVALAGETGLYSLDRARPAPTFAAPIEASREVVATPGPVVAAPTPAPDRWVVVQHTNGLGLVLRPEPAGTARVLLLQEGAQLRVTGDSVQKSGHAWLPVTSTNGATGWVAGEFLAPLKTATAP